MARVYQHRDRHMVQAVQLMEHLITVIQLTDWEDQLTRWVDMDMELGQLREDRVM